MAIEIPVEFFKESYRVVFFRIGYFAKRQK